MPPNKAGCIYAMHPKHMLCSYGALVFTGPESPHA